MAHEKSIPGTPYFPEPTNQSKAAFLKNQLCSLTKCPLCCSPKAPNPRGDHSHSIPVHPKPSQHHCRCHSSSLTLRAAHPTGHTVLCVTQTGRTLGDNPKLDLALFVCFQFLNLTGKYPDNRFSCRDLLSHRGGWPEPFIKDLLALPPGLAQQQ